MRSTKANAAVARLNARDSDNRYSLGITAGGLCCLLRVSSDGSSEKISADLELDAFVQFTDRTGPQKKVRVSKLDAAFEKQLRNKKGGE